MSHPPSNNHPVPYSNLLSRRTENRLTQQQVGSRATNAAVYNANIANMTDFLAHAHDPNYNVQTIAPLRLSPRAFKPLEPCFPPNQRSLSSETLPLQELESYEHQWEIPNFPNNDGILDARGDVLMTDDAFAGLNNALYSTGTPFPLHEMEEILGPTHFQPHLEQELDLDRITSLEQTASPWNVYHGNTLLRANNDAGFSNFDNQRVTSNSFSDSRYDGGETFPVGDSTDTPGLTRNADTMSNPSSNFWGDRGYEGHYSLPRGTVIPGFRDVDARNDGTSRSLTGWDSYGYPGDGFDSQGPENLDYVGDSSQAIPFDTGNAHSHVVKTLRTPQSSYFKLDRIQYDVVQRIEKQRGRTEARTCWPCFGKKAKCDEQCQCKNCSQVRNGPKGIIFWRIPCSRAYLESFTWILLPEKLAQSVSSQWIQSYFVKIADMVFEPVFPVLLHLGFGIEVPLDFQVFRPRSRKGIAQKINWSTVSDNRVTRQWQEVVSYPFTLSGKTPDIVQKLETWTDNVVTSMWYQHMFNHNPHAWISKVLKAVCSYISQILVPVHSFPPQPHSDRDGILKLAMRLCIMTYVSSSTIYLTDKALESIKQTDFGRNWEITGSVAPRFLAMGIKHCLAASIYRSTESCLARFHNMLRARKPNDRAHCLCVLILLAISVALNQVALTDSAHIVNNTPGHPARPIDVRADIMALEDLLSRLIEYYHNIFTTRQFLEKHIDQHWDKMDMPAQSLFSQIFHIYISTGQVTAFKNQEFWDLDSKRIAVDNVPRLLSRVLSPLLEQK